MTTKKEEEVKKEVSEKSPYIRIDFSDIYDELDYDDQDMLLDILGLNEEEL